MVLPKSIYHCHVHAILHVYLEINETSIRLMLMVEQVTVKTVCIVYSISPLCKNRLIWETLASHLDRDIYSLCDW